MRMLREFAALEWVTEITRRSMPDLTSIMISPGFSPSHSALVIDQVVVAKLAQVVVGFSLGLHKVDLKRLSS